MRKMPFKKPAILLILLSLLTFNCAQVDPVTGEKVLIDPNPQERAKKIRDQQGGIFSDIGKKSSGNTFEFATSNVLWRATLKSLDFLPIINADYSGGIIVYDWYSEDINSNERIKVTIKFLGNDLRSDSIEIVTHKKVCSTDEKCTISKLNDDFGKNIKNKILDTARIIKIEELKKNPK